VRALHGCFGAARSHRLAHGPMHAVAAGSRSRPSGGLPRTMHGRHAVRRTPHRCAMHGRCGWATPLHVQVDPACRTFWREVAKCAAIGRCGLFAAARPRRVRSAPPALFVARRFEPKRAAGARRCSAVPHCCARRSEHECLERFNLLHPTPKVR
jgi:hypothetical protein